MEEKSTKKETNIHGVLARSYNVFFLAFILGVVLSQAFIVPIYKESLLYVGVFFIFVGSISIIWSQITSRKTKEERHSMNTETDTHIFKKGPYKFLKYPTQAGLTLLLFGYAFVENSLIILILGVIASFISFLYFVPQQEKYLKDKYGKSYERYKESMKI